MGIKEQKPQNNSGNVSENDPELYYFNIKKQLFVISHFHRFLLPFPVSGNIISFSSFRYQIGNVTDNVTVKKTNKIFVYFNLLLHSCLCKSVISGLMNIHLIYVFIVLFRATACTFSPVAGTPVQEETDAVAERMLLYQRENGGWPQPGGDPIHYGKELTGEQKSKIQSDKRKSDTTIDDQATVREISYLAGAYTKTRNKRYLAAVERGVDYLLKAQYPSGGWGQFFPDTTGYRKHITFNDNAMVSVLEVMREVAGRQGGFASLRPDQAQAADQAVRQGVKCILKCQYVQNGTLTVWCAQHDRNTFLPAKARAFELPSLSGSESVGIVRFLMGIENPGPEIRKAVNAAVAWFEKVKIQDMDTRLIRDDTGQAVDRIIFPSPGKVIWARFYDLETNRPFFTGRDSQPKADLKDIETERRVGYSFYGDYASKLLTKEYPVWKQKWDI